MSILIKGMEMPSRCNMCQLRDVCFTVLEAAECKNFKDHSRFVDIAEVKRKIIRPLCNRCAALTDCQTCPACALEIREHCEHYKEAEQALKERNSE